MYGMANGFVQTRELIPDVVADVKARMLAGVLSIYFQVVAGVMTPRFRASLDPNMDAA